MARHPCATRSAVSVSVPAAGFSAWKAATARLSRRGVRGARRPVQTLSGQSRRGRARPGQPDSASTTMKPAALFDASDVRRGNVSHRRASPLSVRASSANCAMAPSRDHDE